jgi:hypothetical protein
VSRFRLSLLLTGLGGLLACAVLTFAAAWSVVSGVIRAPLPYRALALVSALVLGAFSLAEIPMMVFAMRRLIADRPGNYPIVFGLNSVYVFFAAVYGVPILLLTGSLTWGLALCALGVVRFTTSLVLVRPPAQ